jgi:hypothetical protein
MDRQWPPRKRIELFESMITSLKENLRDPNLTPRNIQSIVTSLAILSDKLKSLEGGTGAGYYDHTPSDTRASYIARELDAVDKRLAQDMKKTAAEANTNRIFPSDDD